MKASTCARGGWRALITLAAGACAAIVCAQPQPADDVVLVPESAVALTRVDIPGDHHWTALNTRMLLMSARRHYYLLVFATRCQHATDHNARFSTLDTAPTTTSFRLSKGVLRAGDAIYVRPDPHAYPAPGSGLPCKIERMYEIGSEEASALREQLRAATPSPAAP
jgi:Family of unknown function (DUF6491)